MISFIVKQNRDLYYYNINLFPSQSALLSCSWADMTVYMLCCFHYVDVKSSLTACISSLWYFVA